MHVEQDPFHNYLPHLHPPGILWEFTVAPEITARTRHVLSEMARQRTVKRRNNDRGLRSGAGWYLHGGGSGVTEPQKTVNWGSRQGLQRGARVSVGSRTGEILTWTSKPELKATYPFAWSELKGWISPPLQRHGYPNSRPCRQTTDWTRPGNRGWGWCWCWNRYSVADNPRDI